MRVHFAYSKCSVYLTFAIQRTKDKLGKEKIIIINSSVSACYNNDYPNSTEYILERCEATENRSKIWLNLSFKLYANNMNVWEAAKKGSFL